MFRRINVLFLCALLLLLSGCQSSRQIETASIIDNVSVEEKNGQIYYTFYKLSLEEQSEGVQIPANSFKEACKLAEDKYIPHLSLAKLELLVINKNLKDKIMQSDIEYISTQAYFSPIAYVALCDSKTIERLSKENYTQRLIEEELILCKKNNPEVKINYLSIFNGYSLQGKEGFSVAYVNSDKEIKTDITKIYGKYEKNQ